MIIKDTYGFLRYRSRDLIALPEPFRTQFKREGAVVRVIKRFNAESHNFQYVLSYTKHGLLCQGLYDDALKAKESFLQKLQHVALEGC